MPVPHGAAQRALLGLTLEATQAMRKREARDLEMGFSEVVQQYQVAIEGQPGGAFAFATVQITFDYPFYYAPGQRDSELDRPHMTFGGEASLALALSAVVTDWTLESTTGAIVGATVAVGVSGASDNYTGTVHLSFQGFAALGEDETEVNG